jgi:FtsZ-binding cell division protein ZapB
MTDSADVHKVKKEHEKYDVLGIMHSESLALQAQHAAEIIAEMQERIDRLKEKRKKTALDKPEQNEPKRGKGKMKGKMKQVQSKQDQAPESAAHSLTEFERT